MNSQLFLCALHSLIDILEMPTMCLQKCPTGDLRLIKLYVYPSIFILFELKLYFLNTSQLCNCCSCWLLILLRLEYILCLCLFKSQWWTSFKKKKTCHSDEPNNIQSIAGVPVCHTTTLSLIRSRTPISLFCYPNNWHNIIYNYISCFRMSRILNLVYFCIM